MQEQKLTAEVEKAEKEKVVNKVNTSFIQDLTFICTKVDIKIKEELERLRMQLGQF